MAGDRDAKRARVAKPATMLVGKRRPRSSMRPGTNEGGAGESVSDRRLLNVY
jgi:hypothetical protein